MTENVKTRYWEDATVGDSCTSPEYGVTEASVLAYAELSGDHTPVHVDEAYARTTPFGTRVAHGLFGLSIADGLKTNSDYRFHPGMSLGWSWDFVAPIKIGDILHVNFHIKSIRPSKSRPSWGIVLIAARLINQHGDIVQQGEHRLMVPRRPEK